MKNEKNNKKILSWIFAASFLVLYLNVVASVLWQTEINHAVINFIASVVPSIFFIVIKKELKISKNKFLLFLTLFILQIITFVLNAHSNSLDANVADFINIISYVINLFGFILLLREKQHDGEVLKKAIRIILICTMLFCVYNIIINYAKFGELFNPKYASIISFASFYNNRNNFAKLLFLSIIVLYYAKSEKVVSKRVFYLLVFLYIINIIATLSRTGIVSTFIFVIMTQIIGTEKQKIKAVLAVGLAALFMFLSGAMSFVNLSIIRVDSGDSGRSEIWREALAMLEEKPFFGYGEHNAAATLAQKVDNFFFHNTLIKNLVVQGVFYTMLYIAFIIFSIKNPLYNKNGHNRRIIIASYVSTIFYCAFEGFDFFNFGLFSTLATLAIFVLPNIYNSDKILISQPGEEKK